MRFLSSLSLIALAAASPAVADVTAEDVWANMQAPLLAMGGTIEAASTRSGNQLEIGENTITFALPEGLGDVMIKTTGFTIAEQGDGTVALSYADLTQVQLTYTSVDGEEAAMALEVDTGDYTVSAAGTPGDVEYTYVLNSAAMRLKDVVIPGEDKVEMAMTGEMTGVTGRYRITEGDILTFLSSGNVGTFVYNMTIVDDAGVETVSNSTTTGGAAELTLSVPSGKTSLMNLSQAFRDGLRLEISAGGTKLDMDSTATVDGEPLFAQKYGYTTESIAYTLDENGFVGEGVNTDAWFDFNMGAPMPMAISGTIDRITAALSMPVNQTDGPVPAKMGVSLTGLALGDGVWGMFDPGQALPRDPADLTVNLSGEMENVMDLLDINALMALSGDDMPVLFPQANIDSFLLRAAGAEITAQGSTSLDYTDMEAYDGIPALDGTLDLRIEGINGLIDTLISTGLLPEDQAMGARMMMGMFTVPGEGEDVLTSTIEFAPDGQISANGQRLR